ncbi:developmentally-regulated protein [Acrasis kona]|uniref:Developmentally-regulated protein n=1 Tax=Acrasis kona TaxID=1008807 RepID=A0AAW2ZAH1_9EUKA
MSTRKQMKLAEETTGHPNTEVKVENKNTTKPALPKEIAPKPLSNPKPPTQIVDLTSSPKTPKKQLAPQVDECASSSSEDCSQPNPSKQSLDLFSASSFGQEISMFSPHSLQFLINNEPSEKRPRSPCNATSIPSNKRRRVLHFNTNIHNDSDALPEHSPDVQDDDDVQPNLLSSPAIWDLSLAEGSNYGASNNEPTVANGFLTSTMCGSLDITTPQNKDSACVNLTKTFNEVKPKDQPKSSTPKKKTKKRAPSESKIKSMQEVESLLSQIKYTSQSQADK